MWLPVAAQLRGGGGGGRRPEKTRIIGGKESYLFLGENPELTRLI